MSAETRRGMDVPSEVVEALTARSR
jgi:hypothetical protein